MKTNINKEGVDSNMALSTPKGMPDYLPEQQIVIEDIKKVVKDVFEKYGFVPLDTPALENLSILMRKGSGGTEIGKEIFTLEDRAGRKLGLRFDLTVPLARVFASNSNLTKPFKRYQEGKVWRQEFGNRTREFIQFDADTLGSDSMIADAEILACYQEIFDRLGLSVVIKINNRELLSDFLMKNGIKKNQITDALICIDKLNKIGERGVLQEAEQKGIDSRVLKKIISFISKSKINDFKKFKGFSDLMAVISFSKYLGVRDLEFSPSLSRGLDYYTGTVFEVFLKSQANNLSLCGGGRYDELIGVLSGKKERIPAVGGSVGVTRIYDALSGKNQRKTNTQLFIVSVNAERESLKLATQFRRKAIRVEIDLMNRKPSACFKYADKMKIPYVLVVGEKEIRAKKFSLKNMRTGKQKLLSAHEIVQEVTKRCLF